MPWLEQYSQPGHPKKTSPRCHRPQDCLPSTIFSANYACNLPSAFTSYIVMNATLPLQAAPCASCTCRRARCTLTSTATAYWTTSPSTTATRPRRATARRGAFRACGEREGPGRAVVLLYIWGPPCSMSRGTAAAAVRCRQVCAHYHANPQYRTACLTYPTSASPLLLLHYDFPN